MKKLLYRLGRFLMRKTNYKIIPRSKFDDLLEELLQKHDFFFIQIGANDGVRFDDLYFKITQYNIRGIVIEPIPKYYKRLKLNYEDYPGVTSLNVAVHPTARSIEIFHIDEEMLSNLEPWRGGIGSIYKSHLIKTNTPIESIKPIQVEAISLKVLINTHNVTRVDLLQIDVEGFDLEIIKMIPFDTIKPKLIKYEFVNLTPDQKLESISILQKNGYSTHIENENAIGILSE